MAYQCRECGVPIAWNDRVCPACGDPNPQGHSSSMRFWILFGVPILVIIVVARVVTHFLRHVQ